MRITDIKVISGTAGGVTNQGVVNLQLTAEDCPTVAGLEDHVRLALTSAQPGTNERGESVRHHNGRTFDAVEVSTVVECLHADKERDYCEVIHSQAGYEAHLADDSHTTGLLYSVYGHVNGEGVECLADCATQADAQLIGRALAVLWGVEVNDYSFTPQQA